MKGFASISITLRIVIAVVVFVAVWKTMYDYVDDIKNMEMLNKMQDVAEYLEAKMVNCLKLVHSSKNTYYKERIYLPDFREYYASSVGCSADGVLFINASVPTRGINYIIREYINCTNMTISGTLLPGGERCITANQTGATLKINLVNNCG